MTKQSISLMIPEMNANQKKWLYITLETMILKLPTNFEIDPVTNDPHECIRISDLRDSLKEFFK